MDIYLFFFGKAKDMNVNHTIKDKLIFEGKYIVALLGEEYKDQDRNVVGLDSFGNIVWKIQPDTINPNYCYTSIMNKDGELYAYNFSTNQYCIDYKTGQVKSKRWLK